MSPLNETHISLAHGNGGRLMRQLIKQLFCKYLANPLLDIDVDAAAVPVQHGELMVTTDGFTVQPLEFPGGDIGSLAIHGTVNDLAVSGAVPLYLTLNVFIEEGLEIALLERIIRSMATIANECDVRIVAGDTKVVPRGEGGGLYLATSGIGIRKPDKSLGMDRIRQGDMILLSGPVGDHGAAIMLAREQFGLRGDLQSDAASVLPLTQALLPFDGLRFMRDPTRGGLATVANEIAHTTNAGVYLYESAIPLNPAVRSVCEILGFDPYYLACEGRIVAVIDPDEAEQALHKLTALAQGRQAAIIGHIAGELPRVILETPLGGERLLDELEDDPLPRIC